MVEALKSLLQNTPYFKTMDEHKNYTEMDWNLLATDPRELYANQEIIHLLPNTGKAIFIMVIPNIIGAHHKFVTFRTCPLVSVQGNNEASNMTSGDPTEWLQIVESKDVMTSKLFIEYTCAVPEILWDDDITMEQQLYAGETYDLVLQFENMSNIGGFFYYDVVVSVV